VDIELPGDGGALVTWLETGRGRAEVRARRVSGEGRASRSWRVTESSDARSSGFPRLLRVGDGVLFAWTSEQGIRAAVQDRKD
jgi:hypothetical protein